MFIYINLTLIINIIIIHFNYLIILLYINSIMIHFLPNFIINIIISFIIVIKHINFIFQLFITMLNDKMLFQLNFIPIIQLNFRLQIKTYFIVH